MGVGVSLGFTSHLVLDEVYSVRWDGVIVRFKASAGSALKFAGNDWGANIVAYGLLFTLTYALLVDGGLVRQLPRKGLLHELPQASHQDPAPRR